MNADRVFHLQTEIAKGCQKSFEALYRLFYAGLCKFAMQYVHQKESAEEVVNDVMIKIWNNREKLPKIENISVYLFTATKNQCLNYREKYSSLHIQPVTGLHEYELVNSNNVNEQLEWKEVYHYLNKAIESLPTQCRTVFRLVKEEGFKYKQVAEILGISSRTVETQLVRAIKKLDVALSTYENMVDTTHPINKKIKAFRFLFLTIF